ncbi:MAG: alcohol dehydrogenase [Firmicutes bacterium HGW-Firmicutes-15]|nr:MAG: alcohol dehydrogenase [Firmicutes bacterium HGW-Firmicutes-15]
MNFNIYAPTRVLFGAGELGNLHKQDMPGKKAMVVISSGTSTRKYGYLDRLQEQLRQAKVDFALFDQVESNPLKSTVESGAILARERGCDFIVALGGGSVIDAAKVMAMNATNPGDLWDYVPSGSGKGLPVTNAPMPVVAITTTAGTGSEVDAYGVITNPDTNEKAGIGGHKGMFPVLAVVDPELMITVPPEFTAYQGWDALSHSMEGYISAGGNIMSDMFALTAIENTAAALPAAVRDGGNLEARTKMAFANTLSGYVMVVGRTTSQHSLEHAMSAYHQELPHGAGLIMLSKAYFTHFINKHACDERFVKMAQVMGYRDAREPRDFIAALERLQEACGVADLKMSKYGIQTTEFQTLAKNARATTGRLFACDRIPVSDEDSMDIYRASYK